MDIADKGQKVGVFFAEDGFVSVFEEMTRSSMAAIVVLGIPREEFSHDRGDAISTTLKQNMDMIAHESPSVIFALALCNILTEPLQKTRPVLFVFEDGSFVDAPHHDMVQSAGNVQSRLPWHEESYRNAVCLSRDLHS
jgi:hypothetical protein